MATDQEEATQRESDELSTARLMPGMPPADPADTVIEEADVPACPPGEPGLEIAGQAVGAAPETSPPGVFQPVLSAFIAPPPRRPAGHTLLWLANVVTFAIAAVSLAINVGLLNILAERGDQLRGLIDQSLITIDELSGQSVDFNFPISQTVDFEGDIPFEQDIVFPVKTNVRISTVVSVPVDLGMLGTIRVNVPIDTTIPVDTEVPVHVSQSVHVKTQVPIEMDVPVHLSADQPPFSDWIRAARAMVQRLRDLTLVPELP
jgi:hypothetical protein